MKILHVALSLDPKQGGPARSIPQLAIAQSGFNHEVFLWVLDKSYLHFADNPVGAERVCILSDSLSSLVSGLSRYDIVHDHGIWGWYHHVLAKKCCEKNIPRVVSARGMLQPWALSYKKFRKIIAWALYQRNDLLQADALHATSLEEASQFKKLNLTNNHFTVPNGVSEPSVEADSLVVSRVDGAKILLYLGRVHPQKGLLNLLVAWKKLGLKNSQVWVVGPDDLGHTLEIQRVLEEYGISDQWIFKGPLEGLDKWNAIKSATAVVLPSFSENFGISVAEGLISGVPVITTTGTPWEGLIDHKCGWWVDPNAESLYLALKNCLCDLSVDELEQMGQRGRNWIRAEMLWDKVAKEMLEHYEFAISNKVMRN